MVDSVSTGSVVNGCVPGLRNHFRGATEIMSTMGDPSALVTSPAPGAAPSGGTIAYDKVNDAYYFNVTGSTWYRLGSITV